MSDTLSPVGGARMTLIAARRHDPAVLADLLALLAAFVVGTLAAELLGAANLGTALTFGTLAFAAVLMVLLLKRD